MISPFTPCTQTQMALYKYRAEGGKVEDAGIFTGRQIKSAKVGEVKKCTKEG